MVNVQEKISEGYIHARTIIELVGRPKEHVEKMIKEYIDNLKKSTSIEILKQDIADVKKAESEKNQELWSTFAELEVLFKDLPGMINFCFDYMPSSIEVIEPKQLKLEYDQISNILNDLQAKLHSLDMAVKQTTTQNMFMKRNMNKLLINLISVLTFKDGKTIEELSKFTGIISEELKKILEQLIKENIVKKQGDKYIYITKNDKREKQD